MDNFSKEMKIYRDTHILYIFINTYISFYFYSYHLFYSKFYFFFRYHLMLGVKGYFPKKKKKGHESFSRSSQWYRIPKGLFQSWRNNQQLQLARITSCESCMQDAYVVGSIYYPYGKLIISFFFLSLFLQNIHIFHFLVEIKQLTIIKLEITMREPGCKGPVPYQKKEKRIRFVTYCQNFYSCPYTAKTSTQISVFN